MSQVDREHMWLFQMHCCRNLGDKVDSVVVPDPSETTVASKRLLMHYSGCVRANMEGSFLLMSYSGSGRVSKAAAGLTHLILKSSRQTHSLTEFTVREWVHHPWFDLKSRSTRNTMHGSRWNRDQLWRLCGTSNVGSNSKRHHLCMMPGEIHFVHQESNHRISAAD